MPLEHIFVDGCVYTFVCMCLCTCVRLCMHVHIHNRQLCTQKRTPMSTKWGQSHKSQTRRLPELRPQPVGRQGQWLHALRGYASVRAGSKLGTQGYDPAPILT